MRVYYLWEVSVKNRDTWKEISKSISCFGVKLGQKLHLDK